MRQTIMIPLIMALVLATAQAGAEMPVPGEPKPFNLPTSQRFTLANGLSATLVEYGKLPQVTVQVVLRTGNLDERERTWLADLAGELLKEGSLRRDGQAIAAAAASMGGSISIGVGPDQTFITGTALAEYGPEMVSLLAEIVREPAFQADAFERIRGDLKRRLAVGRTQPQQLALEAFRKAMYGTHPYGRVFPDAAQLDSFTLDDVKGFYEANIGAQRAQLFVAGRFHSPSLERAVRAAFSDWRSGPAPLIDPPGATAKRRLVLLDRPGAPQSTLLLGLPTVSPEHDDFMALSVMNTLLGGYFSSRITANIREDKGYTYSPFSQVSTRYRDAYWVQSADVTTAHTTDSLREIFKEIEGLRATAPSEAELGAVKNYITGTFVLQNSAPSSILAQLRFVDLHGLPRDYLNTFVTKLNALTPADIQAAARKYLEVDDMTVVVVGDPEAVRTQLRGLEWVQPGDL